MILQVSVKTEYFGVLSELRALLPPGVGVAVTDPTAPRSALYPQEAAVLPPMRAMRRREFLAGRDALREAISHLGCLPGAIPMQDNRAPVLPKGIRASLSHSETLCIAVADLDTRSAGIGLDIEPIEALDLALWDTVCTRTERQWLNDQSPDDRPFLAKQIFCAKEAAYKCQYAVSGALLDFDAFEITFLEGSRFHASFRQAIGPFGINDRICGTIGHVADHFAAIARIPA